MGVRGVCLGTTALLAAMCLTACAEEPVAIDSPPVSEQDNETCNAFLRDLPRRLAGHEARQVDPAAALGRAWGDPAIVVRCGVDVPADFDETAPCEVANGVGWFVPAEQIEDQDADLVFTGVGYRPIVAVDVPDDYRPEGSAAVLAELADTVKDHLELVDPCE
jgi:hypothetical protein